MRTSFLLFAMLTIINAACSGSTNAEPTTGSIWRSDSVGFSLHVSGGMTGIDQTYTYEHASRALSSQCNSHCYVDGGYSTQPVQNAVVLSVSQDADLVVRLQALRESTDRTSCGADAPSLELVIEQANGSQTAYGDDFYAGCQGSTPADHMIAFDALSSLESTLGQLVAQ